MSLPVIDPTQSILGYPTGETWTFQPGIFIASGTLAVTATGLPSGMTINSTTGLITCNGTTTAGVYVLGVRGSDGTLTSDPTYFTVGIEASNVLTAGSSDIGIDLNVDKNTRAVTLRGGASVNAIDGVTPPLITLKQDDTVLFNIRYFDGETQLDPDPDELIISLKDVETSAILAESTQLVAGSTGATAYFKVPLAVSSAKLTAALSDAEDDNQAASIVVNAEIQLTKTMTVGSVTEIRVTSQTFRVQIERDIATD